MGRRLGRRPLAPSVSPKKSVEGALGGLAAAVVVAGILGMALPLPHGVSASVCIGLVLNLLAQMGDLVESLLQALCGLQGFRARSSRATGACSTASTRSSSSSRCTRAILSLLGP